MRRVLASLAILGSLTALGAASCGEALTPADCPGTPTDLKLDAVAPFWGGIVTLDFDVPDGVPGSVEIARYNADLDVWEPSYGSPSQRPDDTYVSIVTVNVGERDRDLDQKLRVRALLDGCPPSEWAESETFKVSDPLSGTTWKAELDPPNSGALSVFGSGPGATTYEGPFAIDLSSEVSHTIAFGTDGSAQEEFKFKIKSQTAGDGFDGCTFDLHVASRFEVEFDGGLSVRLKDRRFASNPSEGSSCSSPPLTSMQFANPASKIELPTSSTGFYGFDYTGLLSKTPGPAAWSTSAFADAFSTVVQSLEVAANGASVQVTPNFNIYQARYEKQ